MNRRLWQRTRAVPRWSVRWVRTHVPRRVWGTLLVTVLLLGTGTVGYRWIEGTH